MGRDHFAKGRASACAASCSDPPLRFPGLTGDVADRKFLLGLAAVLCAAAARVVAAWRCSASAEFPLGSPLFDALANDWALFALFALFLLRFVLFWPMPAVAPKR